MKKTSYSPILLPAIGLAALSSAESKAQTTNGQKQYNIVYIMTDDHTAQMMSCYDNRYVSTPNLDRIANDGVRFVNSFVANSLSGPSRACMLTGKHSHKNGFTNNEHGVFDGSQQTMPKLLQKVGYQTAMIGKYHLNSTPTGFDYWKILPGQGEYYNPDFITMDGKRVREHGYVTNLITDMSIDWLENQRNKNQPFAIFVHHKACHRIWMSEMKYLNEYEDKTFEIPANFYDDYANRRAAAEQEMSIFKDMDPIYDLHLYQEGKTSPLTRSYLNMVSRMDEADKEAWYRFYNPIANKFYQSNLQGKELGEFKFQRYMREYAKVTKSVDDNVGRLLDYLEKAGLLENTLVVYTSDQGFYMGEHGWFDKRFMYEESFNTPLVMLPPKGFKGKGVIKEMVQNIDYAPTFLELAGAKIPSDIQGVSLVPLLKGEHPKNWRKSLYYHFYEYPAEHAVKRHYGVRDSRYKLIHFYNDIDEWELYDLKKDPSEMHNIYGQPGTEKITKRMMKELARLQVVYDDPIREKYPLKY